MVEKGFSKEISQTVAEESSKNHELLSRIVAEEEYGLKEETLENPVKAGSYTGAFYAIGAFILVTPYLAALTVSLAVLLSLLLAGIALAATGF